MDIVPVAGSTMAPCTKAVWALLASLQGPAAGSVAVSWYGVASPPPLRGVPGPVFLQFGFAAAARRGLVLPCPAPGVVASVWGRGVRRASVRRRGWVGRPPGGAAPAGGRRAAAGSPGRHPRRPRRGAHAYKPKPSPKPPAPI